MNKTRIIALGGILGALTLIDLFAAALVPNLKLALYCLSALPGAVLVIEANKRAALVFYCATAALSLLILPNAPLSALPYVLILGLYGVVKAVAESTPNRLREWCVKLIYFNVMLGVWYLLIVKLLLPEVVWPISLWLLAAGAELLFIAGDLAFTFLIRYYLDKLRSKIFRK